MDQDLLTEYDLKFMQYESTEQQSTHILLNKEIISIVPRPLDRSA